MGEFAVELTMIQKLICSVNSGGYCLKIHGHLFQLVQHTILILNLPPSGLPWGQDSNGLIPKLHLNYKMGLRMRPVLPLGLILPVSCHHMLLPMHYSGNQHHKDIPGTQVMLLSGQAV